LDLMPEPLTEWFKDFMARRKQTRRPRAKAAKEEGLEYCACGDPVASGDSIASQYARYNHLCRKCYTAAPD
jgi:hypothetical protein